MFPNDGMISLVFYTHIDMCDAHCLRALHDQDGEQGASRGSFDVQERERWTTRQQQGLGSRLP